MQSITSNVLGWTPIQTHRGLRGSSTSCTCRRPSTLPLTDAVVLAVDFIRIVSESGDNADDNWGHPCNF
jgi:hypothetical protein